MAGFQTHDGKIAGNRELVQTYDKAHGKGKKPDTMKAGGGEGEMGGGEPGDMEEIKGLAAEHGPAHKTETHHDHEGGMHHMHSEHPDGHKHRSSHGSAHEAHTAAMHASGAMENDMDEHGGEHAMNQEEEEAGGMGGGKGPQIGFMQ